MRGLCNAYQITMAKRLMFSNSRAFEKICHGVFKSVDKNKDGEIDKVELVLAMSKMHFKLAKISPGISEPPNGEEVDEMLVKYDVDASGGLSQEEFHKFCKEWFAGKGIFFLRSLIITSFMAMVALPNSADKLQKEVAIFKHVPKGAFKVLFGVVFKLVATRAPGLLAIAKSAAK